MKVYLIPIFSSEEDEGYIADVPDLRCCSAGGPDTLRGVRATRREIQDQ